MESGSALVSKSGDTLEKIVASVSEVRSLVDAMATAGEEQAIGVEGINRTMTDLDGITQKNSAMVKEISSFSEEIKTSSEVLAEKLSFFTLKQSA